MLVWIAGNFAYSPQQWREIIEAVLRGVNHAVCGRQVVLLMVDGDSTDIDAMRSVTTMSNLLAMPGFRQETAAQN